MLLIFLTIVLNRMLLIINWYFFHNCFWPRPQPHSPGLSLVALASASRFWPRLTSLGCVGNCYLVLSISAK